MPISLPVTEPTTHTLVAFNRNQHPTAIDAKNASALHVVAYLTAGESGYETKLCNAMAMALTLADMFDGIDAIDFAIVTSGGCVTDLPAPPPEDQAHYDAMRRTAGFLGLPLAKGLATPVANRPHMRAPATQPE